MWDSHVSVVLLVHCNKIYRFCLWPDDFLSSINHRTHNLWSIYMVTRVEINTDSSDTLQMNGFPPVVMTSNIKKWLPKGLLIIKNEWNCSQSPGPFAPRRAEMLHEWRFWRTRSAHFGQNCHHDSVTPEGKITFQNEDGTHARSCTPNPHTVRLTDISFQPAL